MEATPKKWSPPPPTLANLPLFLLGNNTVPQPCSAGGHRSLGDLVPVDRVLGFHLELLQSIES